MEELTLNLADQEPIGRCLHCRGLIWVGQGDRNSHTGECRDALQHEAYDVIEYYKTDDDDEAL
jgi:hypothetical protein